MKVKINLILLVCFLCTTCLLVSAQPVDSVFMNYFQNAQEFADTYPMEKVHLHFDNTSYYQGDTIWYKAYVVTAERNQPTNVSKPLYVELLDQLGNVVERQIVKIENGEGHGQITLAKAFFTGYYEVRAYTKWMLSFDEPDCFSRTLPIYRRRLNDNDEIRSIGTYRMDKSMKQRPNDSEKKFTIRFFPEGGQLVKGIRSKVAFEASTREQDTMNVQGLLLSAEGKQLATIQTLHDGMGAFFYTPGEERAKAEVTYQGKHYSFELPEALPVGYALRMDNNSDTLHVTISRNSVDLTDTLALFLFSHSRPYFYKPVTFKGDLSQQFSIPVADVPSGVLRLSLLTVGGKVICDRFCYKMPDDTLCVEIHTDKKLYQPFEKICCHVKLRDNEGRPIKGKCSLAVRDGIRSDYREYDNTIYTDLLLTSDLKGYIHQPGYYFSEKTSERREILDILLLVRGWRKYDMEQVIGVKDVNLKYKPETSLMLYGQVNSLFGKPQAGLDVSVLAQKKSIFIAGMTRTDSAGYFMLPVDSFAGTMQALIQTRRLRKMKNRLTAVSLFRNFEPSLRKLDFRELNPHWQYPEERLVNDAAEMDTAYRKNAGQWKDNYLLDQVEVRGKRFNSLKRTIKFEREILGYYDIPRLLNGFRDNGEIVENFPILMEKLNPNINRNIMIGEDEVQVGLDYNASHVNFLINGMKIGSADREIFLDKDLEAIRTVMLYRNITGGPVYMMNEKTNRVVPVERNSLWSYLAGELDASEIAILNNDFGNQDSDGRVLGTKREYYTDGLGANGEEAQAVVTCSIITIPFWDPEKVYRANKGIRHTYIQGYEQPKEFYSPAYPDGVPAYVEDHRRTLYWNPDVATNEMGEAIVQCYNSGYSTPLTVSMEVLYNGCPVASSCYSAGKISGDMK